MDRAGQALGQWLGSIFDWSEQDREIAAFSLTLILSSAFFLALLLALSLAFGVFIQAFAMAVSAGVLRTFAGGAHLSTGWRCGTVSAAAATLVALVAHQLGPALAGSLSAASPWITLSLALLVAWIMARQAPVDVPEKPITSDRQRRRLRIVSTLIPIAWGVGFASLLWSTSGNSLAVNPELYSIWVASSTGLLWETFSIVPPGTRFVRWLDHHIGRLSLHK